MALTAQIFTEGKYSGTKKGNRTMLDLILALAIVPVGALLIAWLSRPA